MPPLPAPMLTARGIASRRIGSSSLLLPFTREEMIIFFPSIEIKHRKLWPKVLRAQPSTAETIASSAAHRQDHRQPSLELFTFTVEHRKSETRRLEPRHCQCHEQKQPPSMKSWPPLSSPDFGS
ncbi:hypothetical protein LR48_Vigan01g103300 [Vigna angularis]|uniref:Uncharacterized protein n=1 Tax=Phaseolus angularis TaxID=3914 RepID=A0A0L9TLM8_PHAAN|nr:hypothetical protein LR48_Vigan01g103300 [Vigna angularis]